jgi:fucose permease
MIGIMFFFSRWPLAYFYISNVTFWQIIGYYLIVIALGLLLTEFLRKRSIHIEGAKGANKQVISRRFIDKDSQL